MKTATVRWLFLYYREPNMAKSDKIQQMLMTMDRELMHPASALLPPAFSLNAVQETEAGANTQMHSVCRTSRGRGSTK